MKRRCLVFVFLCIDIVGCASDDQILRIRSLGTVTNPQVRSESDGGFLGIHQLVQLSSNTNILLVHGIGWTQERSDSQFGDDFIEVVLKTYGGKKIESSEPCKTSTLDNVDSDSQTPSQGLKVVSDYEESYVTDDNVLKLYTQEIGCLDKVVIDIGFDKKTITVYRFLWDDAMWNNVEWTHMGYDDPIPIDKRTGKKFDFAGYDDPDELRAKYNSQLKNSVITYGLTDAAMYIGPIGKIMREGVQAAMCATIANSLPSLSSNKKTATAAELCATQPAIKDSFAIISHSLGSRIVFDVLRTDLTPLLAERIKNNTANSDIEVYMLANQIPLVGVGRLGDARSITKILSKKLKFIGVSEINDLLTYELVPYFEHMYYVRCYGAFSSANDKALAGCSDAAGDDYKGRRTSFYKDTEERRRLIEGLGFDVVDVRAKFATNLFPVYNGFIDPSSAHSGYFTSRSVGNMIFCGAKDGRPNEPCMH
jgi:hypothetical protein